MTLRELLRRAFVENAALKVVALILAVTLFILVNGERDAVVAAYLKVVYTMPEDRVLMGQPVDKVRVTVRGPWTRIKRFDEREIDPIYIDLGRVPEGEFVFQEDMIRLPPGLELTSINPPSVRLHFEHRATRVVPIEAAFEGAPARGYRVEAVRVSPKEATIRGARSLVEATSTILTRRISLSGRTARFTERVALAPTDPHVSVEGASEVEVEVVIGEEPAEMRLEKLPVAVRPSEDAPDLPVGRFAVVPAEVTAILRGGRNAVDRVDVTRISARVELRPRDVATRRRRPAPILLDGIPEGVAVELHPRQVVIEPR